MSADMSEGGSGAPDGPRDADAAPDGGSNAARATEPDAEPRFETQQSATERWASRRREKIRDEIARNRRGDYKVPTWVLLLILIAFVIGWVLLIVLP